ncbi:MAG: hypothetical protein LBH05_08965 [Deferribacteraceae bacterium]|jgi:hypothetical protein|nr:hypothetical protein [Deferribacteraceae bacterium]
MKFIVTPNVLQRCYKRFALSFFGRGYLLALFLCILSSCAGKQPVIPELTGDKEEVLRQISHTMSVPCEYRGRAVVRFRENETLRSAAALVNKECRGDMNVQILGPFGIRMAELSIKGDRYFVIRGDKDVTGSLPSLTKTDLALIKNSIPPPVPDERYTFSPGAGRYIFTYGEEIISVQPDFYVNGAQIMDYKIDYQWDSGMLKNIRLSLSDTELTLEFTDPWN